MGHGSFVDGFVLAYTANSRTGLTTDKQHGKQETRGAYAASVMVILSAIGSLVCCLPFEFLAAFGTASASAVFATLRPGLLVLSAILLVIGLVKLYCGGNPAGTRALRASQRFGYQYLFSLGIGF